MPSHRLPLRPPACKLPPPTHPQTIKEEEKHLKQAQSLRRQAERLRLEEAAKDAMEAEKKEAEAAAALRTAE